MRIVSLNNDDVCYQDGGNSYIRGYSGGAQQRWLEAELAASRANAAIDWIVVCMHQVVVSTVDKFNGADRGIRESWVPLFDRYGVDLVVCGHEHHYERSHPIRGQASNDTLTPIPVSTRTDTIDTTKGTVHMVIGGGTSAPSNALFSTPAQCRVITGVGPFDLSINKRPPIYVTENAPWSAVRDPDHPYGFAAFDVDPGRLGGITSIHVTYYAVSGPYGDLTPVDRFTLTRPAAAATTDDLARKPRMAMNPSCISPAEVLSALNRAWVTGRLEDLERLLHPRSVIVGPDLVRLAERRDACVSSYRDFLAMVTVHAFEERDIRVEEFHGTAVVAYAY